MASTKITALANLAAGNIVAGDLFVLVDVSDSTMAPSGTDKNYTWTSMLTDLRSAGYQFKQLASDFPWDQTSLTDVTGMSVTLEANGVYQIDVTGSHVTSGTTEAMRVSVNGSTAASNIMLETGAVTATNVVHGLSSIIAYDGVSDGITGPGATARPFWLRGTITNGAASSTLFLRVRAETGGAASVTIKAGTTMVITRVA